MTALKRVARSPRDQFGKSLLQEEKVIPNDSQNRPATTDSIDLATRKAAFEIAIQLWPTEIEVTDKQLLPGDGLMSPSLNTAWDEAESKAPTAIQAQSEVNFMALDTMLWLIFTCLHRKARNENILHTQLISFEEVDNIYLNGHFRN